MAWIRDGGDQLNCLAVDFMWPVGSGIGTPKF